MSIEEFYKVNYGLVPHTATGCPICEGIDQ